MAMESGQRLLGLASLVTVLALLVGFSGGSDQTLLELVQIASEHFVSLGVALQGETLVDDLHRFWHFATVTQQEGISVDKVFFGED